MGRPRGFAFERRAQLAIAGDAQRNAAACLRHARMSVLTPFSAVSRPTYNA